MTVQFTAVGLRGWRARLACAAFLLLGLVPVAWGQPTGTSPAPATGSLHAPAKQKPAKAAAPTAPLAAPRPVVREEKAKPTPLVKSKGPVHAQPVRKPAQNAVSKPVSKPGAPGPKGGTQPAAKSAAKPAAGAAAVGAAAGAAAGAAIAEPVPQVEPTKGTVTGMPLPRFAALRSDEVNLRTGPGVRYPIEWVYKRRDLPVEIEREFEVWRLVQDQDGVKGWVHQATLTGRRSFVVTGAERILRNRGTADASAVARLEPGVVGRIRSCEATAEWCQVQVGDYRGWLKRDEFWGILPDEAINN